jgi:DNA-binding protein HU-beta
MNKSQLIDQIAVHAGLTKTDSAKALDGVLKALTLALKAGESVTLVGFGTFSVVARPEREGRNPKTKETMTIAASNQAKFKAGKTLKDAVQ